MALKRFPEGSVDPEHRVVDAERIVAEVHGYIEGIVLAAALEDCFGDDGIFIGPVHIAAQPAAAEVRDGSRERILLIALQHQLAYEELIAALCRREHEAAFRKPGAVIYRAFERGTDEIGRKRE